VVVLALAVRLAFIADTPGFSPMHDADSYDRLALTIEHGRGYPSHRHAGQIRETAYRPPGYPHFLAVVYRLTTDSAPGRWTAARIAQALLGAVAVALLGILAWLVWRRRGLALLAMALAALYMPLITVGSSMYAESIWTPLLLAAVVAAVLHRSSTRRLRWVVLSGVLLGLTTLTRPNAGLILIPLVLVVWTGRPRFARGSLLAPVVLAVATLLTIAPWTIRNAFTFHEFVPITTETGSTLAGTYNDYSKNRPDGAAWGWQLLKRIPALAPYRQRAKNMNEPEIDAMMRGYVFDYIKKHPTAPLEVGYWNMRRMLELGGLERARKTTRILSFNSNIADAGTWSFWVIGVLALLGCFTRLARRVPRGLWMIPVFVFLGSIFIQSETPRFRIGADPFFILLAVLALTTAWERVAARRAAGASDAGVPPAEPVGAIRA
jgi:4-amino-4-deoxy-L-arabinose transferase-like glycosyltransferase